MKDKNKHLGIIIGVIILIVLVAFALYFSTNRSKFTDNTNGQVPEETAVITPTPTAVTNGNQKPPSQTAVDQLLAVYLDKNQNMEKDQNEINCGTLCINKELLLADAANPANPKTAILNAQGKLTSSQVMG